MSRSAARSSRAVVAIGMHRSGTSAIARGLQTLGVYLGNDFLDAQPENPTGYWEDRRIVELNERVLKSLNLRWDSTEPLERRKLTSWRMWNLRRDAVRDLRGRFAMQPLWGFKDPRTIRLLPFWERVLDDAGAEVAYLLAIRNPASVAASLHARQAMDADTARRLWLVHMVPFLRDVANKPLVVVDFDLLMNDPRAQLERVARRLHLPILPDVEVARFAADFLDEKLRHTVFSADDLDASSDSGRLTRDAFVLLHELASDRRKPDAEFWEAWRRISSEHDTRSRCRTAGAWPDTR
jgi:hypothetical protein